MSTEQTVKSTELDNLYAELATRELARRNYYEYLRYVNGKVWKDTNMAKFLAEQIQAFLTTNTGHAYDILIIETPPQHGKSMTVTESLPSWYMGNNPENRVIIASYNEAFAEKFCRRNKEKLKAVGANLFGVSIGSVDRSVEFELDNKRGALISRGILSGITGNPANLIIIDDPIKNMDEADSPTMRDKLWEEWQASIKSRLAAGSKVVIIMTPWHEDDFAARILNNEPYVRLLRLPVEAEENDPLGREVGDPLCPELGKDKNWLEDYKLSYLNDPKGGQRAWTALYQCSPRVESGNLVHRDWWRFYDPADQSLMFGTELISVDASFKDKDTSDFVSVQVWGKRKSDYYLRYCMNKRMDFPTTVQAIRTVKALYPRAQMILIEDKANGPAIIQTLQHEPDMYVIAVNPQGGKVARVNAVSAAIESGHVYLPDPAQSPWVVDFVDQFTAFPNGAHDDMCFVAGTKIATLLGDKPIEAVRRGDRVITPYGLDTVEAAGITREATTVVRCGLEGTPDHPVYTDDGYIHLDALTQGLNCSKLSVKELILWTILIHSTGLEKSCLMALPIDLWVRGATTSANLQRMREEGALRVFMSLCGNFLAERKYLPAMKFIIKTATASITTLAIWSVYRLANIGRCLKQRIKSVLTSKRYGRSQKNGTPQMMEESGTSGTTPLRSGLFNRISAFVSSAAKSICRKASPSSVATTAMLNGDIKTKDGLRQESASTAEKNSSVTYLSRAASAKSLQEPVAEAVEENLDGKKLVYNLKIRNSHLYYAGGFLVHNCDAATQALNRMMYSWGEYEEPVIPEAVIRLQHVEKQFNDPAVLFNPYGTGYEVF